MEEAFSESIRVLISKRITGKFRAEENSRRNGVFHAQFLKRAHVGIAFLKTCTFI